MNGPSASHLAALAVISDLIRRPSEQQIPVGGVVRAYAGALALYAEGADLSDQNNGRWLPIETAPKDRSYILLTDSRYPPCHLIARWEHDAWWGRRTRSGHSIVWREATHWMPLPPAPGEQP